MGNELSISQSVMAMISILLIQYISVFLCSQWTNALFRVDTRKCQTLKESNRVIYSQSREILYSMSGVTVSLLSGILPMCSFGLLTVYEALEQFNLFHITNFANHSDYLLLGSTSKGSVAVLNPYGQILKELKFPSYFGATSLTSNSESLFISFTNYDSLESSIIIEYDPDLKKKEGHEIELEIVSFITASTDYIIGISKDRDKIVSINLKDREPEWLDCTFTNLKNVALVDNNAPYVKRDVCGENSSVCHNIGNIVGCDNKVSIDANTVSYSPLNGSVQFAGFIPIPTTACSG